MDLIDRQAAIKTLEKGLPSEPLKSKYTEGITVGFGLAITWIEQLPAVPTCDDAVSRQVAIDALIELYEYQRDIDPTEAADLVRQGVYLAEKKIEQLPSVQSKIIRCKECKYWHREIHNGIEYFNFSSCDLNHYGDGHNFYCADAERRTDER